VKDQTSSEVERSFFKSCQWAHRIGVAIVLLVAMLWLISGCTTAGIHTAKAGRAVGRTGVLISVVSVSSVVLSPLIIVGLPIWLAGMPIYYSGCSIAGEKPEKNPFDL
jgi:hypothetical protein